MLPGNRRKMLQILVRDNLSLLPQIGYCFGKVHSIPEDNRSNDKVQSAGAVVLLLPRPIKKFSPPIEKDGFCKCIARFALIQSYEDFQA